MPSISALFNNPPPAGEAAVDDFDMDTFFNEADAAIKAAEESHRPPAATVSPVEPVTENAADLVVEGDTGEAGGTPDLGAEAVEVPPAPTLEPVAPVATQVVDPQEERLSRIERMLEAAATVAVTPPAPVAVVEPEPKLPDYIDPSSFEATLWAQQQETQKAVRQIAQVTREQHEASVASATNTAAQRAGEVFAARYADKLTPDDVMAIAVFAGQSGVASTFATSMKDASGRVDLVNAYDKALEHTLWTNPTFRSKMIEAAVPAANVPGNAPEAQLRKRKLTALSSGSSPVSAAKATRDPLVTGADGRLEEKSRRSVVKELAAEIAKQNNGQF